jgi:SAM-dependent methyltransferase
MAGMASLVVVAGIVTGLMMNNEKTERTVKFRNFYGTVQITEDTENGDKYRQIYNGAIKHGLQFLSPAKARTPTTYYGVASGPAIALKELQDKGPVRVGVIGLGAGTMAAYDRPGDYFRFYDINPLVIDLAWKEFTFLSGSPTKVDVVQGDARLSLEREQPQNFDLLCVDAFSGDSIPIHLLTKEAFAQYFRHLAPGGVLAVHVTNKHLELAPVVKLLASDQHAHSRLIINTDEDERQIYGADWVIVTRDDELDNKLAYLSSPIRGSERMRLWTDDYSNLFTILKTDR